METNSQWATLRDPETIEPFPYFETPSPSTLKPAGRIPDNAKENEHGRKENTD